MHRPGTFAALLGLTRAASAIGDFWVQTEFCARVKAASDDHPVTSVDPATHEKTIHGTADGRQACLHHCLTYTATQAIVVGLGARALGIRVHPGAAAAALALSFGTHYAADRRVPGHGILEKLAAKRGKTDFYQLADFGMNGAFHLDSSWHHGWETLAALIATTKATTR
ncbi:hypothetical protein [Streptomyces fuscichromogenes]|uniref:Uncharacterized protein n=1 Tax=Streptomyces fuscichromogenes TaxID=1324013 RepID=A0A917XP92_9ACTN|nr:hypothetical protein [Streptomyces fuscichromogenes]GGN46273.1 hypothetical protein GCM10011578_099030 [Streptomyces fuscichromogenes]